MTVCGFCSCYMQENVMVLHIHFLSQLPQLHHPGRKTEENEQHQTRFCVNSGASETSTCEQFDKGPIPMWRSFLKGICSTHIVLTFVPTSYSDLWCAEVYFLLLPQINNRADTKNLCQQ
jgi:hypothetical protein